MPEINEDVVRRTYKRLFEHDIKIGDLNPLKPEHVEAVKRYLKEDRQFLIKTLKTDNELLFVSAYFKDIDKPGSTVYKDLIYLNVSQYTDRYIQSYLRHRIDEYNVKNQSRKEQEGKTTSIICKMSMDDCTLLCVEYCTTNEDLVYYYDQQLGIPSSLKSRVRIVLKFHDAVEFIKKIDVSLGEIGYETIKEELLSVIRVDYKKALLEMLDYEGVGFYKLTGSYGDLSSSLKEVLGSHLFEYGIDVKNIEVRSIDITNDAREQIEKEMIKIRNIRENQESDVEYNRLALENYEKKAAIHEKYPNFEVTLTEAEKDFALRRYMLRTGTYDEKESVNFEKVANEKAPGQDDVLKKTADKKDKINNSAKTIFVIGCILSVLACIIVLSTSYYPLGGFLIAFGCSLIVMGAYTAIFFKKIFKKKTQLSYNDSDIIYSDDSAK